MGKPLLSSYASGKSVWFQPPLGRPSHFVLRLHPAAFVLIPASRLKLEHCCSFPVSQCMRFCCFPLLLISQLLGLLNSSIELPNIGFLFCLGPDVGTHTSFMVSGSGSRDSFLNCCNSKVCHD